MSDRHTYGVQPGRQIFADRCLVIARVARKIGVSPTHLKNSLSGLTRPRPEVREKLPEILNVPLEQIFTEEVLRWPYQSRLVER